MDFSACSNLDFQLEINPDTALDKNNPPHPSASRQFADKYPRDTRFSAPLLPAVLGEYV